MGSGTESTEAEKFDNFTVNAASSSEHIF